MSLLTILLQVLLLLVQVSELVRLAVVLLSLLLVNLKQLVTFVLI